MENEVDRLKKQINNDSNNSFNPHSSDIKKNIPNNKSKSKKSKGCQKGHQGYFLLKEHVANNIKSIIITCKKQGIDYYNVIKNIFENKLVKI